MRELGKRWTRLTLTPGLSIGAVRAGADALICFSRFLTLAGFDALAEVDRALLERYPAHVMSQPGGPGMKKTRIGALNLFFQEHPAARLGRHAARHAAFYLRDISPVPERETSTRSPVLLMRWPSCSTAHV